MKLREQISELKADIERRAEFELKLINRIMKLNRKIELLKLELLKQRMGENKK